MTKFSKGDWTIPGTWVPHLREDGSDGAIAICIKCGRGAVVTGKIEAQDNYHGLLMVPFICPNSACGWKDEVQFMWWNRGAK